MREPALWYHEMVGGRVGSLKIRSRTLRAFSAGALPTLDPVRDTHRLYARRCLTTPVDGQKVCFLHTLKGLKA